MCKKIWEKIMDEKKTPHQRRPHYKGHYPREFREKYKELNPEKYADTIDKVERKGSTPAGYAYSHYG
jgi:16S rRNA (cytosine1402-N4)-methyltransferase